VGQGAWLDCWRCFPEVGPGVLGGRRTLPEQPGLARLPPHEPGRVHVEATGGVVRMTGELPRKSMLPLVLPVVGAIDGVIDGR